MLSVKQIFNGNTVLNDLTITDSFNCTNFVFIKANNLPANEGYEIAASLVIEIVCREEIVGIPITTNYGEKEIPLNINFVDTEQLLIIPEEVTKQGFKCHLVFATSYQINITVYAVNYVDSCCEELKIKLDEVKRSIDSVTSTNIIDETINTITESVRSVNETVNTITEGLNGALNILDETVKALEELTGTGNNNNPFPNINNTISACCNEIKTKMDELKLTIDTVNTGVGNVNNTLDNTLPSFEELNELYRLLGLTNANNQPTTNLPVTAGLPVLAPVPGTVGLVTLPIVFFIPGII